MEGLGNFITNLGIHDSTDSNIGLFAQTSGSLRDLGVEYVDVVARRKTNSGASVGALVGTNVGTVAGCHGSGLVVVHNHHAETLVGGLVGTNTGTVTNSHASVSLSLFGDGVWAGGLVGSNSGTIEISHASGNVTEKSKDQVGDLGGLVGSDDGSINVAFATGAVTGGAYAGGLAGLITNSISNTYALGSVSVRRQRHLAMGGLVGVAFGTVDSSYSIGTAGTDDKVVGGPKFCLGGSIGRNDIRRLADKHVYWDVTTSGLQTGVGCGHRQIRNVIGLTTDQLKSGLPAGFDTTIWAIKKHVNHGFPYLLAIPPVK